GRRITERVNRRIRETRRRRGHEDDADALVLAGIRVRPDREPDVVRVVGQAREDLLAIDDPLVTFADRACLERRKVGARLRLAVADRDEALTPEDLRQHLVLQALVAELLNRRSDRVDREERERRARALRLVVEEELFDA